MKLPLLILLALAVLSIGRHRVLVVPSRTVTSGLGIENSRTESCMAAFHYRHDGPGNSPAAYLSVQNSILCVSFDSHRFLVLEWSGSRHLLVFLETGRRKYA
jgi:hypothetical protein